jgi:hypothetical protein
VFFLGYFMLLLLKNSYGLYPFVVRSLMMMHGEVINNGLVVGFDGFLGTWVSHLYLYLLRVLRFRNLVGLFCFVQ